MPGRSWKIAAARRCALLLMALGTTAAMSGAAQASTVGTGLSFDGDFSSLSPWTTGGGGPQCANYGTQSKSPRERGTFSMDQNVDGVATAGRFDLPTDSNPATYPLEACNLITPKLPIGLGSDGYYGLMVYVPAGWTIPNNNFTGVEIEEYHFQNVYGAPISYQLHADHVTLALQMGACSNHTTASPGCTWHSNADSPNGNPGTLPAYYAIPPGALQEGSWNEILMHVHWASDNTGQIQTYYKVKGAPSWTQSSNVSGVPTVQWDTTLGCCAAQYSDETEAYAASLTAPLSVWLGGDVTGSTFSSVDAGITAPAPPAVTPAPPAVPAAPPTVTPGPPAATTASSPIAKTAAPAKARPSAQAPKRRSAKKSKPRAKSHRTTRCVSPARARSERRQEAKRARDSRTSRHAKRSRIVVCAKRSR